MKKQSFFHPFLFLFLFFESPLSTDETYQVAEARTDMSNARDRDRLVLLLDSHGSMVFPVAIFHIRRVSSRSRNCFNLSRLSRAAKLEKHAHPGIDGITGRRDEERGGFARESHRIRGGSARGDLPWLPSHPLSYHSFERRYKGAFLAITHECASFRRESCDEFIPRRSRAINISVVFLY